MKKVFVAVLTTSIALSGCASIGSSSTAIQQFEADVLADAAALCKVEPTVASIALLFPIYGTGAKAAADAICAAVNNTPVANSMMAVNPTTGIRRGIAPVVVHGVTVHFN